METRVLQVNVDECNFGGVFSLVLGLDEALYKTSPVRFDFYAFEKFQDDRSIQRIKNLEGNVFGENYEGNKIIKQFVNFIRFIKFLKKSNYKTVHVHADLAFKLFLPSFAARLCKIPKIIIHSHNSGVDGTNRLIKKIAHEFFKLLLPLTADSFLSCSKKATDWMYYGKTINKVKFIKNGIDSKKFSFNENIRTEYRRRYNLENKFVIGHVGRFGYQKNHSFLIDIFKEIALKDENALLLLVGEGELREDIEKKVSDLNLSDRIIFWGGSYEVYNLYQMMDIFLLPSFIEGLPLVGVEAQAAGLPSVFSDNITTDVKITNDVYFLSLNSPAKVWADKILEIKKTYNRTNNGDKVKAAGFDIAESAAELEKIYS